MADKKARDLPLGTSDFARLRTTGKIYVDKTGQIYDLLSTYEKVFLARPRRFGKSLLVSTFESLFKYGLRDFKGLAIEKLWKEEKTYNVVRLDFSEIKVNGGIEKFRKDLSECLNDGFSSFGFVYDSKGSSTFRQLSRWFKELRENSVVILIDEYDAPLTSCLNDAQLFNAVRGTLSELYAVLKSNDRILRFVFITGITKFNKINIFSELNNLSDLSLDPQFGTLLGYSHQELQRYFAPYLSKASKVLQIEEQKLLQKLTAHYDGFCFEETAREKVFAPWSLLNFFAQPTRGLKDYWFESGGKPAVLMEYLKSHSLRHPEEYGREKTISLSSLAGSSDVEALSDIGLLTQAGYLTIKEVKYGDTVFLDYPNLEVRRAMAQLYIERLLNGRVAGQVGAGPIVKVLSEESAESVFHILNRLFLAIDYQNYPVRDESSVRAYVQVYFAGAGLEPKVELHNACGRSDLEVSTADRHWVFEFKVIREGENEEEKLREGIEQMTSRHYGEQESAFGFLRRVVLVYSIEFRQFVKWREV